jgi:Tfp pilus assembly protein PilN
MINLIPTEGQKKLQREYQARVVVTFSMLFGFVFLFLGVALVPTYVLVGAQMSSLQSEASQGGTKNDAFLKIETETKDIEKIIAQIEKATSTLSITPLITEVTSLASDGVRIRALTIAEEKGVVQKIQVQGTADTRQSLVAFRDGLEASEWFKKAEVPLADLARDSDLPFSISVMLERVK